MLDNDLRVTLNTDDPGVFNLNYLSDIYLAAQEYIGLTKTEITQFAKNSFEILWIDRQKNASYLKMVESFNLVDQ
jgi:adenosine deaminase